MRRALFAFAWALFLCLHAVSASAADEAAHAPIARSSSHGRRAVRVDMGAMASFGELRLPSGYSDAKPLARGIPDYGGGVSLGVGIPPSDQDAFGLGVRFRYAYARPLGLGTHFVTLGPEARLAIVPALHVVGGLHAAWLGIQRATRDALVQHWGVGMTLGVEVLPWGAHPGLFVRPEATATIIPHTLVVPSSAVYGGTLTIGARI